MDHAERSLRVQRILTSTTRVRLGGCLYLVVAPQLSDRLEAEEIAWEIREEAVLNDAPTDADCLKWLKEAGVWSEKEDEVMVGLHKDIETLKVSIFELAFRSTEQATQRKRLASAKALRDEMLNTRHQYDHLTANGLAVSAKTRILVGCSLRDSSGRRVWGCPSAVWDTESPLLDEAVTGVAALRLGEAQLRELARSEPWASLWAARNAAGVGVFGKPAIELTDEQIALTSYSDLYDRVREHPEGPPTEVIEDDDALDGWLILQRRKSKRDSDLNRANETLGSDKLRQAGDVFLMADTDEDAARILALNDRDAQRIVKERVRLMKERGEVQEQDLPDVQQQAMANMPMKP